jgi:hypothetical protein
MAIKVNHTYKRIRGLRINWPGHCGKVLAKQYVVNQLFIWLRREGRRTPDGYRELR